MNYKHFEQEEAFDISIESVHTYGMEEVLAEIIAKEKEAESIVHEARQHVQEIQREADIRSAKITEEARQKAGKIFSELVAAAENKAKQQYEENLEKVKNMKNELFRDKSDELEKLIDEITDLVISSDLFQ